MEFTGITLAYPSKIDSNWQLKDYLGALRVRSSIGRNRYKVKAGLYKLGNAGPGDEVFVTANYKLSFDLLRRNLKGIHAWILVLDTHGINVWCAAGKGTFGTQELIHRIRETSLSTFVSHKRIILPQLGAPGIAAHKVKDATGFNVKYGPVRSQDIKSYLEQGRKKDPDMRSVRFNLKDRLILAPVEISNSLIYLLIAIACMMLISGISPQGFSFQEVWKDGRFAAAGILLAYISGTVLGPMLLPVLPTRYFAAKGYIIGFIISFGFLLMLKISSLMSIIGWLALAGTISSFLTMNFTGSSTYTSLSGVRKEMRLFIPVQLVMGIIGIALIILSNIYHHEATILA